MLIDREKVCHKYYPVETTDNSFEYQLLGENMNIHFELTCMNFTYLVVQ